MIWFGGDYNPEQWPEEVWAEDIALMQEAGVNLVTVGVFAWANIEPREGEFNFGWLDRILDHLAAAGVNVDLATATASPPPWLTKAYPDVLPVTESGVRLSQGSRQHYCPSSATLRRLSRRLVTALAQRYAHHPAVTMWHVNNEYGCHVSHCYCEVSADAFRHWLQARYRTVESLNVAWGTSFWSQHYSSFGEVEPPRAAPATRNPAQLLDFDRFSSDELLACMKSETAILRQLSPDIPLTTNFIGFFKAVDYWGWAKEVDLIANDSYPNPADSSSPAFGAMVCDLMRSLGNGKPWVLMEQAPGAVNWRERNARKLPGQLKAWSFQAIARGACGVLFFQWRQSRRGAEKFHSGMLPHAGTNTRIWREICDLGDAISELDIAQETQDNARVAIVFEWDSWWTVEQAGMPTQMSYLDQVFELYESLYSKGVLVDFVKASFDLHTYDLVIAPSLFCTTKESLESLDRFAAGGGNLLVTYQSAIIDGSGAVFDDGYLGTLQKTLGLWVEEFAPLISAADIHGRTVIGEQPGLLVGEPGDHLDYWFWSEQVHVTTAVTRACYSIGPLAGSPAITKNQVGRGSAWYLTTRLNSSALSDFLGVVLMEAGIAEEVKTANGPLEVVNRAGHRFVIDHDTQAVSVETLETEG